MLRDCLPACMSKGALFLPTPADSPSEVCVLAAYQKPSVPYCCHICISVHCFSQ